MTSIFYGREWTITFPFMLMFCVIETKTTCTILSVLCFKGTSRVLIGKRLSNRSHYKCIVSKWNFVAGLCKCHCGCTLVSALSITKQKISQISCCRDGSGWKACQLSDLCETRMRIHWANCLKCQGSFSLSFSFWSIVLAFWGRNELRPGAGGSRGHLIHINSAIRVWCFS